MVGLARDQAVNVALGAESWVISILQQDLQDGPTDHLGEIWASELPGLPIEGGEVFGAIEDLQGRFNVNNLVNQEGRIEEAPLEQFRRLLNALGIDPRFAGIAADWIDTNVDASFPDGAEDPIYTGMIPPYRTANQTLTSVSELAAIEGMDRETFRLLEQHIVALPGRTGINVNTATPAVLQSLDENMTTSDVEGLVQERAGSGFGEVETSFASLVTPEVLNTLEESTRFFRLKVVVRVDTVRITMFSVLQRAPQTGTVTPILRSFGTT
jgi:general secretion pathway protein K